MLLLCCSPDATDRRLVRTVLIAAAGNLLEWYDFAIYGIFAAEVGTAFFPPTDDRQITLIRSFSVFGGAFVVRPLGGILFGHIGDTRGREVALLFTILLMALPTLIIGLLPTYETIGVAAPILLTAMRLLQGIAAGGELPGALVYAVESAGPQHRAQMGALCQASGVGSLLASFIAAILHLCMSDEAVTEWGWRIPFCFGSLLALLACIARRNFRPTHAFLEQKKKDEEEAPSSAAAASSNQHQRSSCAARCARALPCCAAIGTSYTSVLRIVCSLPISMAGFYGLFVFIPANFRSTKVFLPAFALNVIVMLVWAFAMLAFGALADATRPLRLCGQREQRIQLHGYPLISACGAFAMAILSPILFASLSADCTEQKMALAAAIEAGDTNATSADEDVPPCVGATQPYVFIPLLLLAVLAHACHAGPLQAWMVLSLRETRSRYSALGIAYNLGAMLLGGTFPLIATSISASALGMTGAGLYLSFGSLVAAITLILTEKFAPTVEAERALLSAQAAPRDVELTVHQEGPRASPPCSPPPSPPPPSDNGDADEDEDGGCDWMFGDKKSQPHRTFRLKHAEPTTTIRIRQSVVHDREGMWASGAGGVVWEAAEATVAHIDATFGANGTMKGMSVIECGAGTGVCGLACAALGASRVALTDLPSEMNALRTNLDEQQQSSWVGNVGIYQLDWCAPSPFASPNTLDASLSDPDLLICCDCLYRPASYPHLVKTIRALKPKLLLVSWVPRGKSEDDFFELLQQGDEGVYNVTKTVGGAAQATKIVHLERSSGDPSGDWAALVSAADAKGVKDAL